MLYDTFDEFDRLSSAMFSALAGVRGSLSAPVNLSRDGDRYILDADLPGVDPGSIDVSVEDQWLTIRAERSDTREHQDAQWLIRERRDATVLRRVAVSRDIDLDAIEASYRDGVLKVILPVAETAKPRKIAVTAGSAGGRRALGASVGDATHAGTAQEETAQGETARGKAQPAHSVAS